MYSIKQNTPNLLEEVENLAIYYFVRSFQESLFRCRAEQEEYTLSVCSMQGSYFFCSAGVNSRTRASHNVTATYAR